MSSKNLENFKLLLAQYKQNVFPEQKNELSPISILESSSNHVKIPDQQIIELLLAGCKSVGHSSDMSRPFCQFFYKQIKQTRASNLRQSQFDCCIGYIFAGLDTVRCNDHVTDLLRALSAIVFENVTHTQRVSSRLSDTLIRFAKPTQPLEVRRMAINCIGNTCAGAGARLQPLYNDFYVCLLENICRIDRTNQGTITAVAHSLDFAETAVRKIASSTLRSLQFLLAQDKSLIANPLCDILEIIYAFIFMHVSVQSYSPTPRNRVLSVRQSQLTWRPPTSASFKAIGTSSESEQSDSSSLIDSPKRQRDYAKIRINALLCLSAVARCAPKMFYPSWSKFIPDTFSLFFANNSSSDKQLSPVYKSDNQPNSLLTILLYDPAVTVRVAVCNTLIAMLEGSKQYLSLAVESPKTKKSSFTSLSESLGSIIHDLHQGITYSLQKEQNTQVLVAVMHSATVLVENCSYQKLSSSHLPLLYDTLKIHRKEPALYTSMLLLMCSIFSTGQENLKEQVTDLTQFLLSNMTEESYRAASVLTKNFFEETMPDFWEQVTARYGDCPVTPGRLHLAETYSSAMVDAKPEYIHWWYQMIERDIQQALTQGPNIRAAACNCFASLSKNVFEAMEYRYQRLAITLLHPMASDSEATVRAAACRALGVFVLFPSLQEDSLFVSSMMKAILVQREDKNTAVLVRSSWALANMCDALVNENEKKEFELRDYMSTSEWINVLDFSTKLSKDSEKLRSNAVRAMGSLLRVTPKEYFENTRILSLISNAMGGLVKNIEFGSLKTRWNACHAASNMLSNPDFPIGFTDKGVFPWTQTVYGALIRSLSSCKNFKVRINACLALSTPNSNEKYGNELKVVSSSILEALNKCQEAEEYTEIKYRNQLETQIKLSLGRFQ